MLCSGQEKAEKLTLRYHRPLLRQPGNVTASLFGGASMVKRETWKEGATRFAPVRLGVCRNLSSEALACSFDVTRGQIRVGLDAHEQPACVWSCTGCSPLFGQMAVRCVLSPHTAPQSFVLSITSTIFTGTTELDNPRSYLSSTRMASRRSSHTLTVGDLGI